MLYIFNFDKSCQIVHCKRHYVPACMLSHFSCVLLFATLWTVARQAPLSMGFSSKNAGVGCHALLQGIFLTQGLNLYLFCLLYY